MSGRPRIWSNAGISSSMSAAGVKVPGAGSVVVPHELPSSVRPVVIDRMRSNSFSGVPGGARPMPNITTSPGAAVRPFPTARTGPPGRPRSSWAPRNRRPSLLRRRRRDVEPAIGEPGDGLAATGLTGVDGTVVGERRAGTVERRPVVGVLPVVAGGEAVDLCGQVREVGGVSAVHAPGSRSNSVANPAIWTSIVIPARSARSASWVSRYFAARDTLAAGSVGPAAHGFEASRLVDEQEQVAGPPAVEAACIVLHGLLVAGLGGRCRDRRDHQ